MILMRRNNHNKNNNDKFLVLSSMVSPQWRNASAYYHMSSRKSNTLEADVDDVGISRLSAAKQRLPGTAQRQQPWRPP